MSIARSILSSPSRHLKLTGEITYLTGVTVPFSGERALSFSLSEGSADGRLLGGAFSAACTLTLDNSDGSLTAHRSLWGAYIRVFLAAGEEETPLCAFTVAKVTQRENDSRLVLSGSDALGTAFEGAFEDDLSYPLALGPLAAAVAARAGFSLAADFPNADFVLPARPAWGDVSLRQALAFIACAAGCFACISREGQLVFRPVWPGSVSCALPAEMTLRREYGGAAFGPLTGLSVACACAPGDASPLSVSIGGAPLSESTALSVSGNPLFPHGGTHTQALAQRLLETLSGLKMARVRLTWRGDPQLCLGHRLRVTDAAGNVTDALVTSQTLTFFQGFSMQTDCAVPSVQAAAGRIFTAGGALNAAKLTGSVDGIIIRDGTLAARALVAGSVTAVQLAAQAVTADKIASGVISTEALSAVKAEVRRLTAGQITADQLYADLATIAAAQLTTANIQRANINWANISALQSAAAEVARAQIQNADIGFAQIKDLTAGTAIITEGTGGKLFISRLAVDGAQVQELLVNQLYVKNSQGQLQALTVDARSGKVQGGALLADRSVDAGSVLIEHSITASELNVSQIFADQALVRSIKAVHIDVADLFAAQATINALNAMDIRGNQYLRLYINKNFSQWEDPALTDTNQVQDGDIWNKDNHIRTWADLGQITWAEAGQYKWRDFKAGKQFIRRNGAWELVDDPGGQYGIVSGIDIFEPGIEISGRKYVRIRSGGVFRVDSGNFGIDSNGNVTLTGVITALEGGKIASWLITEGRLASGSGAGYVALDSLPGDTYAIWAGAEEAASAPFSVTRAGALKAANAEITGKITSTQGAIGGWDLAANALSSGSGESYVALNSGASNVYAMWAGAQSVAAAPFRVKRDGTAYVTKLVAVDKNNTETNVNLRTAGLWKLGGHTISSYDNAAGTITLSDGTTLNFNRASSVTLAAAGWQNGLNRVSASNGQYVDVSLPPFGSSQSQSWLNHKKTVNFTTTSVQAVLRSELVDATDEYNSGVTAGWAAARAKVETPAAGTGTSFTVKVPSATQDAQQTLTFSVTKGTPSASGGYAAVSYGGNAVAKIALDDWWNGGYAAGESAVTLSEPTFGSAATGDSNTCTVTASNGESKSVELALAQGGWSGGVCNVYLKSGGADGTNRAQKQVSLPSSGTWAWSNPAQGVAKAQITICGKTYSSTKQIPSGWM